MAGKELERSFGREAFGLDPATYDAVRPHYPEFVWDVLREEAGLRAGIAILEIGAGTGLATRRLLGAEPAELVAIEPDPRLCDFLRSQVPDQRLTVIGSAFEDYAPDPERFDLAVSATAFHWLEPIPALLAIRRALRPHGAAVALVWNVFGDSTRPDPFHDASQHLFNRGPANPWSGARTQVPFALDALARLSDLAAAGFETAEPHIVDWSLALDPFQVRRLYSTFSNVTALPPEERERLLDGLFQVAETEFAGRVVRNMTTSVYIGRRP